MQVLFVLCADASSIDAGSNKLSIFNVSEELRAASFPAIVPSLNLVIMLRRQSTQSENVDLIVKAGLNGKFEFQTPLVFSFQGRLRARAVVTVQNIQLSGPGELRFSIFQKNKMIGSWPIEVISMAVPTATQPSPQAAAAPPLIKKSAKPRKSRAPDKRTRAKR